MPHTEEDGERKFRFYKTRRGMIIASLEPYEDLPCDFTREANTPEEIEEAKAANPEQTEGAWEIDDTILVEVATAHG